MWSSTECVSSSLNDERDSLEWVRRLLEDCKAEVCSPRLRRTVLRLVSEKSPDVIVSDIGMPEKDGLEMMRELRARSAQAGKFRRSR